jgi:DNA processing protein
VSATLSNAQRRAWLRLSRTQNVGAVTFAQLIERFGSAEAALEALPGLVKRGGGDRVRVPSNDDIDREIAALDKLGGRMLASCEPEFPRGLAAADPPPPIISALGHVTILQREIVAIVGARNASALGRRFASTLARDLSGGGLVIASGLARGIDTTAHEGALPGGTCAVVAGGVDNIYPPENATLYERIRAEGCIVSEMPLGQSPQARHFPRRNRIISGLSRGVVIVEAAEGSGSLITANFALEQGREIFAVPGSPLDPRAKGTNRLIREGATLVESAEDVLAGLRPILGQDFAEPGGPQPHGPSSFNLSEAEASRIRACVEEALGPAPVEVDELVRSCNSSASAVLSVLLEMELAGRVARHSGNRVSWA